MTSHAGARILASLLAVTAIACSGQSAAPIERPADVGNVAPRRVAIAVLAPTRGEAANIGNAVRAGVGIAVESVVEQGLPATDVEGIDVIASDGGDGSVDATRKATRALAVRTDVIAVVIALDPLASEAVVSELAGSGAAVITANGFGPDVVFDVTARPIQQASAAGRLVGEVLRARKPATLGTATASYAVKSAFARSVDRFAATPIAQTYPFTADGGIDPLGELAKQGVDAVYVTDEPAQLLSAVRQASLHRLRAPFVLPDSWQAPDVVDAVLDSGVHAYLVVPLALDDGEPITADFVDRYRRKRPGPPPIEAAMAYDATRVALAALAAAAHPLDPYSVRTAMTAISDVPSLSGPLSIDQRVANRPMIARELLAGVDRIAARVRP